MFWKLPSGRGQISMPSVMILGITVWLIYVLDRLLDNQKSSIIFTERHLFHQSNQRILWFFVIICTCICTGLLFFIPFDIIKFGIVITLITGLYLLIVNQVSAENAFQYFKEPTTCLVYVSGVFGTTILNKSSMFSPQIGFIFLLIVFQNLLLFSLFELKKSSKSINLASCLGIPKSNLLIILLTCLIFGFGYSGLTISSEFVYFKYEQNIFWVEILMSFVLLVINQFDRFFLINDRYRWVGDGIFLLPLLIIFR